MDLTWGLRVAYDVAALTAELTDMAAADHRLAGRANSDDPAEQLSWRRSTARHGDRLNAIMDEYGWPIRPMPHPSTHLDPPRDQLSDRL
ncbi:hypothetical protein ACFW42_28715 [Streptomyces albidoflavus]